jgi:adenylate cyclase
LTDTDRRAAALVRVRERLRQAGATDEEIDRAVADDVVDLLAVDRILVPAPQYDQQEVAERTGMSLDLLRRFWLALGFAHLGEDEKAFSDLDIGAVRLFQGMLDLGMAQVDTAVQLARVIGSSMERIAEAEVSRGGLAFVDEADSVIEADVFVRAADHALPAMAQLLGFVWRRHVQAATRRAMLLRARERVSGTSPMLAVGFADMVGFTLLSQHLRQDELAAVVRRFEDISHEIVTGLGGRVVKMIGDEVMFVVDDPVAAARIGIGLAEAYADDDLLSDVRVGLALGRALVRDGDYYGPTVNLAHRIVNIANPGTVLISDELHRALTEAAPDEFSAAPLRPRFLKDLGRVQLWWCGRAGQEFSGTGLQADRRRNRRWERLAEVLRDLEELRNVGERLLSGERSGLVAAGPADDRGAALAGPDDAGRGDTKGA